MGWADSLEEEVATHSSILTWEIPWTDEPGRLELRVTESDTAEQLNMYKHTFDKLLLMSCMEELSYKKRC